MKTLFAMTLMLVAAPAMAKTEVMNQQQFLKDIQEEIGDAMTDGELSIGGGGSCDVKIEESEGPNGHRVSVNMVSESKTLLALILDEKDQVNVQVKEEGDGSYSKTYTTQFGTSVTRLHVDDAYDEVTIDNHSARLTCGLYY